MAAIPLSEKLQTELKAALEAAALPRACAPDLLAALLLLKPEESAERLRLLRELGLAEPAGGDGRTRVPRATRIVLRHVLATVEPSRFRALSLRAAAHFQGQTAPEARIEWLYHLLCGDPEQGAEELRKLDHEWTERGQNEARAALGTALRELEETGAVAGRARAWVLLVMAWRHEWKGETDRWAEVAEQALEAAREAGDPAAEAEALCQLGDARKAQFHLEAAEAAYGELLALCRRHPDSADWQRTLAAAHSRVGDVAQVQGRLDAARAAFTEYLAVSRRLSRQYPADAGWQRELAIAHSKMGHVLKTQGQLERARADFADYLAGFRKLVEQDPGNLGWQRELAVACGLLANIRMTLDGADAALPYYEESARLFAAVTERAPGIAQWAEDRRRIEKELAACRLSSGVQRRVKGGLSWLQDKLPF